MTKTDVDYRTVKEALNIVATVHHTMVKYTQTRMRDATDITYAYNINMIFNITLAV